MEAAASKWAGDGPILVQPFISGIGEGVFGLATNQGIRAWSAHRRLRMMNPHGSGSSACSSQPVRDELRPAVERFIRDTRWHGLFMIELLRDRPGKTWFMEFNGRAWGSMALSRRQGLEYPAWNVESALAGGVGQINVTSGNGTTLVCKHLGREFMHLLFVLRGPRSKALSEWPSLWKTLREVFRIRKCDRIYNWRKDEPKVFLSDCYNTICDNIFKERSRNSC